MGATYITPEEALQYISTEEDQLGLPAMYFTFLPCTDERLNKLEEGWEDLIWLTGRKKSLLADGSPDHQWVYILQNEAMPGLLKIGYSDSSPERRVKEISRGTGVPVEFSLAWVFPCFNGIRLEKEIHSKLEYCRVNKGREFFRLPLDQAISVIEELGANYQFKSL